MLTVVPDPNAGDGRSSSGGSLIDEIVREGARRMLAEALRAEVDAYVARFAEERDENGRRLVVRMARISRGRCSPAPARSRSPRRG
jgi:putative transposase